MQHARRGHSSKLATVWRTRETDSPSNSSLPDSKQAPEDDMLISEGGPIPSLERPTSNTKEKHMDSPVVSQASQLEDDLWSELITHWIN